MSISILRPTDATVTHFDTNDGPCSRLAGTFVAGIAKKATKSSGGVAEETNADEMMTEDTWMQMASLSKTVGAAFGLEYFSRRGISWDSSVNEVFRQYTSSPLEGGELFQLVPGKPMGSNEDEQQLVDSSWVDEVKLFHLVSHSALGMHYVNGFPIDDTALARVLSEERGSNPSSTDHTEMLKVAQSKEWPRPSMRAILAKNSCKLAKDRGYDVKEVRTVRRRPSTQFKYSGGGFMVLQHLLESMEACAQAEKINKEEINKNQENADIPIEILMRTFLDNVGMADFSFEALDVVHAVAQMRGEEATAMSKPEATVPKYACGYRDDGSLAAPQRGRLLFPALAAGGEGTTGAMASFLASLLNAYSTTNEASISESMGKEDCMQRNSKERIPTSISHDTAVRMLHADDREGIGALDFMGAEMGLGVFVVTIGSNRVACHQGSMAFQWH